MAGDTVLIYYRLYVRGKIHWLVGKNVCKSKCGAHQNGDYYQYLSVPKKHKVIINLGAKYGEFCKLIAPFLPLHFDYHLNTANLKLFRKPTQHYNTIIWSFVS